MGMFVIGIKPPDETWKRMKAAWEACEAAGVTPPPEVLHYFEHVPPDPAGVVVEIRRTTCVRSWRSESGEGFEVDTKALPPDVTVLRFWNS